MRTRRQGLTLIEMLVTIIGASVVIAGLATVIIQMLGDQKDISVSREQAYARARATSEITWTLKQAGRRGLRQVFASPGVNDVDDPNFPAFTTPAPTAFDDVVGSGVAWGGVDPVAGPTRPYPLPIQQRGVITYVIDDYHHPETFRRGEAGFPGNAPLDPTLARSGIIYQFDSVLYRFERRISELPAGVPRVGAGGPGDSPGDPPVRDRSRSGFNGMTAAGLAGWIGTETNRLQSEVLAVGVDRFEVNYVRDRLDPSGVNGVPANRWSVRWNLVFFRRQI